MQYTTNSEKQTFNLAKKFSKNFKGGEIIGLIGDLGAGKTIFSKGLAAGLGIKKNVTSPTFNLMKIYKINNSRSKIKNLVHIDAYRIKFPQEIINIGAQEYFNRPDTIIVIEWVDKIKKILPKHTKYITIKYGIKNLRLINY